MWPNNPWDTRRLATVYLFLRTRTALEFADETLWALDALWNAPFELLNLGPHQEQWENGVVFRIATPKHPIDLAEDFKEALAEFDAWAIHDGHGGFAESSGHGLIGRYFESAMERGSTGEKLAQIFVLSRPDDRRYQETIEQIRASFRSSCLPAFHFTDGQIMFLDSAESGKIANQRCARGTHRLRGWGVVDSTGRSFSRDGEAEAVWESINLGRITFAKESIAI